jgi:hypothetical protein
MKMNPSPDDVVNPPDFCGYGRHPHPVRDEDAEPLLEQCGTPHVRRAEAMRAERAEPEGHDVLRVDDDSTAPGD